MGPGRRRAELLHQPVPSAAVQKAGVLALAPVGRFQPGRPGCLPDLVLAHPGQGETAAGPTGAWSTRARK